MKFANKSWAGWLAIALISLPASGAVIDAVKLSTRDKLPEPRWMFDKAGKPQAPAAVRSLAEMKRALLASDYKACLAAAGKARASTPELKAWIAAVELDCATRAFNEPKSSAKAASDLSHVLSTVENTPSTNDESWFAFGAQAPTLRDRLIEGRLALLSIDVAKNRVRAADGISHLETMQNWMDDRRKARLWYLSGELAYYHQQLEESRELLQRSLDIQDSREARDRLATIEQSMAQSKSAVPLAPSATPTPTPAPETLQSAAETEITTRISAALKAGDPVAVIDDCMKLITDYPGGTSANWAADRVREVFLSLADKSDPKYTLIREKVVRQMLRADPDRTAEWARVGYNRGLYQESLQLAKSALDKLAGTRSTPVILLAGEAAIHVEQFDTAKDLYQTLVDKHRGTPASQEGLLRVGLIEYRLGRIPEAIAMFERLLALQPAESQELLARHWLWRALQKKNDVERARAQAEALIARFPFTYYGLRAQAELANATLEWKRDESAPVEVKMWLTTREAKVWKRAQLLLSAGWLDEAQAEIRDLPMPRTSAEKAFRARVWAAALSYPQAMKLLTDAWDSDPSLRRQPFLSTGFPREFKQNVDAQAAARKLDPSLILGVIRQESSFYPKATSPSQALGLMQLVPPTAREIAVDLKMGPIVIPEDLFDPARNIKMGSFYLAKLVRKYSGHVPMALASYNAGPGKIDRWLKSRKGLVGILQARSSSPDDELWMDELPWDETSFYVKAILRNVLLYRVLEKGKIEIKSPIWAEGGQAVNSASNAAVRR